MKKHYLTVTIIIIFACLKYFWFLPQLPFDADQEYLAVKSDEILSGKLTLLGAPTSIGGMFIGPLYSYFVAAVMFIFKGNPLVINGLSAFWAALTIIALFFVGRRIFSSHAGIFAAIIGLASSKFLDLAGIPPLVIPLTLLVLIFLYASSFPRNSLRNLVLGILVGLSLNLHFSGIFLLTLLPFFGIYAIAGVALLLVPLFVFELKHGFFITKSAFSFLSTQTQIEEPTTVYHRLIEFISSLSELINLHAATLEILAKIITVIILILSFKLVKNRIFLALLYSPLVFFLLYPGLLLPYYAAISWGPFLLILGAAIAFFWNKSRYFRPIIIAVFLIFSIHQFKSWSHPSTAYGLDKKLQALQYIKLAAGDKQFHLSRTMYPTKDFGYPYLIKYLDINSSSVPIDPTYTLVSPADWHQIKSDITFGDIGIVLPKEKNNQ